MRWEELGNAEKEQASFFNVLRFLLRNANLSCSVQVFSGLFEFQLASFSQILLNHNNLFGGKQKYSTN